MTETSPATSVSEKPNERVTLGVGSIVATSTGMFFKRLHIVALLALPAMIAVTGLMYVFTYELWTLLRDATGLSRSTSEPIVAYITATCAIGVATGLSAGPLASAATAYVAAKPISPGASFARIGIKPLQAIATGMLVTAGTLALMLLLALAPNVRLGILMACGCLALGMYALARWGLALPVIPLERMGMRALRRSEWLSADYRWPLTGTFFLLFVIAVLFGGLAAAGLMMLARLITIDALAINFSNSLEEVFILMDVSFGTTIAISVMTIGAAVMRIRLIEIKEPLDIEDMIDVFE
jgi:hypothetical protein